MYSGISNFDRENSKKSSGEIQGHFLLCVNIVYTIYTEKQLIIRRNVRLICEEELSEYKAGVFATK